MPCAAAYAWAAGERDHAPSATSSPPTCSHGDGNRSASAPATASRNGRVAANARVEHVVDERLHADGAAAVGRIPQLRHRGKRGEAVPRQVDLGDDDDAGRRCPGAPTGDLRGRVRAAERRRTRTEQRRDRHAVTAPGADLGQSRVAVDRQAPGLVVGQVHVQSVEAPPGGDVDQPVDIGGREELPGQVDVQAAPVVGAACGAPAGSPPRTLPRRARRRPPAMPPASRPSPHSAGRRR